ncbi:MAG: ATP-dependent helicase [Lachnospiraceae bacterium]|nr:ATP-dependent helicase [Lachnospiraceae bacterium]
MEKNYAQEEVIHTIEGQLIVIACPGSGKTTTLVRRIHHMVEECKIPSEHILMITFTSAAAKEMKERYHKMYGQDDVTFSTIHSLCLAVLRKFCGLSNENIMADARDFFFDKLRSHTEINDKDEFIKMLLTDISVLKNNSIDMEYFEPQCCDDKYLFEELYDAYEEHKENCGLIDFDDMLIRAYEEMKNNPECLKWMRNKFQYIQVDEYQDTNYLQRDIVYLLAGDNGNLAVVGDDDQSIYGFRGARPEIMLRFQEHYPDVKVVKMNTNYRSYKSIIDAADKLIQQNKSRFAKEFQAFNQTPGAVETIIKSTQKVELFSVVTRIKMLIETGEDPNNIAVLYRTNRQAEAIASLLNAQNIQFVSTEAIPSKYEHWMFYDIQSFQKLAKGEKWSNQDLFRVLNKPQRFLQDYRYVQAGLDEKKMKRVAFRNITDTWKRDKAIEGIHDFFFGLNALKGKNPKDFLENMTIYIKYLKYLKDYAQFRNMDYDELFDLWQKYKEDAAAHNDWVEWGRYIMGYNKALEDAKKNQEGVSLSTMHCSKGLEWEHVFIIDCVEDVCPFKKAETEMEIEEERRLFYVAMTRAKKHLYMYAYKEKGKKEIKKSPFLLV